MKINEIKNGNINKIYLLEVDNNKYIIRISNFDNSFECKVLELLKKYEYNCPKIITSFELNGKYIMIYRYLEGNNPNEFNDKFFISLAQLLRKLHSINCDFSGDEYILNEESQSKLCEYYNKAIKSKYLLNELDLINKIYNEVLNLELDGFKKCIIHSDVKRENTLQNQDELFLIDFGNCYIGSRLIDIVRVIMWFFIKNQNYDYRQIQLFINSYFDDNNLTPVEKNGVDKLFVYCVLYNLLKDISLNEDGVLTAEYIENNSLSWLESLKNKEKILKIGGMVKNA